MGRSEIQGSDCQHIGSVYCDECFQTVEVVPLAVAENLAAALGAWCPGSRVLADYRAAYPAKETP